ncbi:MAG: hypothetical protein K8F30_08220 [Taibaiella sp.]|nr:hypothetical protein [Taibaiella sp.]
MSREKERVDKNKLAVKNRKIFTQIHTILGMPAMLFMLGICFAFISIVAFHSFFAGFCVLVAYFVPMLAIHKHDEKGLKIWSACLFDSVHSWSAGSRKKIRVILISEGNL